MSGFLLGGRRRRGRLLSLEQVEEIDQILHELPAGRDKRARLDGLAIQRLQPWSHPFGGIVEADQRLRPSR